VKISIYDVIGKETILVENSIKLKGKYLLYLQRNDLKPEIYLLKLITEKETITKKIIVVE
jgi:hypothetical protein